MSTSRVCFAILGEELDVLHAEGSPDYQLALDIMHYMTQYPDLFHHPREDVVFERMLLRDPSLSGVLGELLRDHQRLAKIGLEFHDTLAGVLEGRSCPERSWIAAVGTI